MIMKRIISVVFIMLLTASFSKELNAQPFEDFYKRKTSLERKPAPLPGVREADVIWSKTIWRIVDLREKMNQPFYYPTREMQGRKNLINLLLKGIENQEFPAFDAGQEDDEFKIPISYDQVKQQFGASAKTTQIRNFETGAFKDTTIQQEMRTEEVKQLMLKELWYFDKQKSTMQVRILGICPIRLFYRDEDVAQEVILRKKLFWIRYPEIRNLLAKNESLNSNNSSRSLSFDDVFLTRKFDSYIVKEENIYNNRSIEQYASGEYASKESDRIKTNIFNYEQDLWEY